jgi:hypothetical protein
MPIVFIDESSATAVMNPKHVTGIKGINRITSFKFTETPDFDVILFTLSIPVK